MSVNKKQQNNKMKHQLAVIIAGAAAILLSSCAATTKEKDKNAPTGPPSATLTFGAGSAAYWASASGGSGTLNYQGKEYPFSSAAVGLGGSGAQKVKGTGQVYNLNSLADFEGNYSMASSGLTLLAGKKHAKLTNKAGVIIYIEATTHGLASSFGKASMNLKLK